MKKKELEDKFLIYEEIESVLWAEADFVFDTNTLINFYDYPEETLNDVFYTRLESLKGRLWLPAHVEYEYMDKRVSSIIKPEKTYVDLKKNYVEAIENKIIGFLNDIMNKDKHPHFENQILLDFQNNFNVFKNGINKIIDEKIKEVNKIADKDLIRENIENRFRLGSPYLFSDYYKIAQDAEFRFKNEIPPGYMDYKSKKGFQKYGDLIIWKQILKYAKENKKSIIFITDDLKEDWWLLDKSNRKVRPRDELRMEFFEETECDFWMYSFFDFIKIANEKLPKKTKETTLSQVKNAKFKINEFAIHHIFLNWLERSSQSKAIIFGFNSFGQYDVDFQVNSEGQKPDGYIISLIDLKNSIFMQLEMLFDRIKRINLQYYKSFFIVFILLNETETNWYQNQIYKGEFKDSGEKFLRLNINFIIGYIEKDEFMPLQKN